MAPILEITTPEPVRQATTTPMPSAPENTLPNPTAEPVDEKLVQTIEAYASCNGRFTGQQYQERAETALATSNAAYTPPRRLRPSPTTIASPPKPPPTTSKADQNPPDQPIRPSRHPDHPPTHRSSALQRRRPSPSPPPSPTRSTIAYPSPQTADYGPQERRYLDIQNARWLASHNPSFSRSISSIPWIEDGLNDLEYQITEQILYLVAHGHDETVARLINMPFLQRPHPHDLSALKSIFRASRNHGHITQVINHPALENGITDEITPVISVMDSAVRTPQLMDKLFDPHQSHLETTAIRTTLDVPVSLAVIRDYPPINRAAIDQLAHAVIAVENIMATPFPTNSVVVLITQRSDASVAGTNFNSHILISSNYDAPPSSRTGSQFPRIIAHEVAHHYWHSNEDWIDEGVSELMASIALFIQDGRAIDATNPPCFHADNINQLAAIAPDRHHPAYVCNYSLGERLQIDLLRTAGDVSYRQRIRQLYLSSKAHLPHKGRPIGIEALTDAFADVPQTAHATDRWVTGTRAPDTRRLDLSKPSARIPNQQAAITDAHTSAAPFGPPSTSFSSTSHRDWIFLVIQFRFLQPGQHEIPIRVEEFYEDGFRTKQTEYTIIGQGDATAGIKSVALGTGPNSPNKPGQYWAMVYHQQDKIAEVTWMIEP